MSQPSWLNEENVKTASTVASNPAVQAYAANEANKKWDEEAGQGSTSGAASSSAPGTDDILVNMGPEDYAKMKKYASYLAIAYILCAVLMATAAVLSLNGANASTGMIALYVFVFALLIFCFDFAPCMGFKQASRVLANNCGFMYSGFGRVTFLIFVAVLNFHLKLFGQIVMGLLLVATILHMYIIVLFPSFSAYLRRSHLVGAKMGD